MLTMIVSLTFVAQRRSCVQNNAAMAVLYAARRCSATLLMVIHMVAKTNSRLEKHVGPMIIAKTEIVHMVIQEHVKRRKRMAKDVTMTTNAK